MRAFTFIHAADLHLDSPLSGLRAGGPVDKLSRQATFRAFERIVELCLREKAAFLLLAGDLFDAKDGSVRARLFLRQQLVRLDRAGIRTFIAHGNHDPLSGDTGAVGLPASVKVFGSAWEEVELVGGGERFCRVQGISYPQERVTEDLSRFFQRVGPEFTIGLLHANVGGQSGHANYSPCALADLSSRGLDYWALGHVHTRAEHPLASGGRAVYPGNPQGRHVKETGERGCMAVEVEDGHCRTRFVPLDSVRWHALEIDLSGCASLDVLIETAEEAVDASCGEGVDAHALRLVLRGRSPIHRELSRADAVAGLEEALRGALVARSPPVVLEAVVDQSAPLLDLAALAAGGGLPAQVLELAERCAGQPGELERLWTGEADLNRLELVLRRAGVPSLREGGPALLERALGRALSLLVEEG